MRASRRRVLALTVFLVVVGALLLRPRVAIERAQWLVFGSLASVEMRGVDSARAREQFSALQALTTERERQWHPWRESNLTQLNAALAEGRAFDAPPSLINLIDASMPLVERSHGCFDPGAGGLIAAWGFHTSDWPARTAPPDAAWLRAWREDHPSLRDLARDGSRVRSTRRDLNLDFNAIAEGVMARELAAHLRAAGVREALIDLGGDVYALGTGGERGWRVGIRDPRGGALGDVMLGDGEALFVSGAYAKYREDAGHPRAHVVDPRDGQPVEDSLTTAVITRDPALADAAATALLVAGADEWRAVARDLGIDDALLLTREGELLVTPSLARRLRLTADLPYRVREVALRDDASTATR